MKKKISVFFPILCLILIAALVVSFFLLRAAKSDVAALEKQITKLTAENQQLSSINLALQIQVDSLTADPSDISADGSYCSLFVDSWTVKNNTLTVDGFAQAVFADHVNFDAKLEIWKDDEVLSSQDITLTTDGADSIYEANVSVKFEIPQISPEEELELWLMVAPAGGTPLFSCGAGWYLENGQLMIIAG